MLLPHHLWVIPPKMVLQGTPNKVFQGKPQVGMMASGRDVVLLSVAVVCWIVATLNHKIYVHLFSNFVVLFQYIRSVRRIIIFSHKLLNSSSERRHCLSSRCQCQNFVQ